MFNHSDSQKIISEMDYSLFCFRQKIYWSQLMMRMWSLLVLGVLTLVCGFESHRCSSMKFLLRLSIFNLMLLLYRFLYMRTYCSSKSSWSPRNLKNYKAKKQTLCLWTQQSCLKSKLQAQTDCPDLKYYLLL